MLEVEMSFQVPVVYEKGVLRPLKPLDLPEHTQLTVTVSMPKDREHGPAAFPHLVYPTRPQPLYLLEPLIGAMPAGGDALQDSEALYDEDW
jgi:hypothetical protein